MTAYYCCWTWKTGLNGLKKGIHSMNDTTGRLLVVEHRSFCFHSQVLTFTLMLCLSESWNFLNSSWIRTEKTYLYFVEITILIHYFLLGHFERVKVAAQDHQIGSLIISFQRFDLISVVSVLLESVLRPLEVLKFPWGN